MLTADTYVQRRVNRSSKIDSHLHQLANAVLIEFCEWIVLEDLSVIVSVQEFTSIVTGESVSHLSKVVGSEAEEVCLFCDLICSQRVEIPFNTS